MVIMANNDFNAALALFQSLYRSHKGDIFTIIERFILAGVRSLHLSTVTVVSVSEMLREQFHIDIPNIIIQNCINNQNVFHYKKGEYLVVPQPKKEIDALLKELEEIDEHNETIVSELYHEIEHNHLVTLTDSEKENIREVFFDFVKDRDKETDFKYFIDINQYIVKHEKDRAFQEALDAIKEGMIIYHGIRYSEASDDKTWKDDTVFFLDMEYLFNACGMNGTFFEECFYDFYNLVKEINDGSPWKHGVPRIQLKYFTKTKDNIDRFFNVAARIKNGEESLYNDKEAMRYILNNSSDEIGVLQNKAQFFKKLNDLGISEYTKDIDLEKNKNFIFDTSSLSAKMEKEFTADEKNDIDEYLLFADYINILRCGKNTTKLEKCGFIFLSDSKLSTRFSKFLRDNDSDARTFLICRMSLFTEDMWFKLRKGIVNQESIATLKVISKAKSIVSGLLTDSVTSNYKKIIKESMDPEEKKMLYAELRSKRHAPEHVTADSIEEDVSFILDNSYIENYRETQSQLRIKAARNDETERLLGESQQENKALKDENKDLPNRLRQQAFDNLLRARNIAKRKFALERFMYSNAKNMVWVFILIFLCICIYFELSDIKSPMGMVSGIVTVIAFILQINGISLQKPGFFCENDIVNLLISTYRVSRGKCNGNKRWTNSRKVSNIPREE